MRKRYSFESLFEGNKIVLMCILFTVSIIIATITNTVGGRTTYITIKFLLWSVLNLSAPIMPITIFQHLWKSNFINDKDYLFLASVPLHYLISLGLILFYTFIRGFFEPWTHEINVYIMSFINYTAVYIIIVIGAIVIDLVQTSTANKNLRIIQASKRNANK